MRVRDWPWWRLLVRVTPLLNVHRTEEQLKLANEELQTLKAKLEKIEADRGNLKGENSRLESKVSTGANVSTDSFMKSLNQRRRRRCRHPRIFCIF